MIETQHQSFAVRGRLLLGSALERGVVVVERGLIAEVRRGDIRDGSLPAQIIDSGIVSPGLIDLQVNGAIGKEVGATPADIDTISRWLPGSGVTAWLPTVVTSPSSAYPPIFASWPRVDRTAGAVPLGLHLEGPFISVARKGAHRAAMIDAADDRLFASWLSRKEIALVTVSPERDGNLARIRQLVEHGVTVSLGHTDASYEEFAAGIDAGATKATHLFNAMSPIHHRAPGAMTAAMLDDRVCVGLIPDGIHTHPAMLELARRTKGVDRIVTVSDMMTATGLGPGKYGLAGQEVDVSATDARLADATLAGSILTMDDAVRNLTAFAGFGVAEALVTATAVPAAVISDSSRGQLRVGERADLTLWSDTLHVERTIVSGVTRFESRS